jgi:hypothetical protein
MITQRHDVGPKKMSDSCHPPVPGAKVSRWCFLKAPGPHPGRQIFGYRKDVTQKKLGMKGDISWIYVLQCGAPVC